MSTRNNLKNSLLEFGFTANEAQVYLALLELGSSTAGPLIAKTGLHRNVVYTSLQHLKERRLVTEASKRGKKNFTAVSPVILEEEFEQKARSAKKLTQNILQNLKPAAEEITIHQGNEEYLQLLTGILKAMPKGSTKYVIGTGGEEFMAATMRPIWKKYHQTAKAQKIKIKMIGYENQRSTLENDIRREGIYEMRYLPDEIENPAGVHVYPEIGTILNIIYSDKHKPVTTIRIKNKQLAEGYLNFFNNLWKIGKE
ncbi:MAG TPA: helix-turn-helix domain-containing protein [Patescibacteria group bacterium]